MGAIRTLRIAAVSRRVLEHGSGGGMERYFDMVTRRLERRGHAVTLLTEGPLPGCGTAGEGRRLEPLDTGSPSRRAWARALRRALAGIHLRADVVLSNSFAAAPAIPCGVPVVPIIHGTGLVDLATSFRLLRAGRESPLQCLHQAVTLLRDSWPAQRRLLRHAGAILAVSRHTADSTARFYRIDGRGIRIAPAPVNTSLFHPSGDAHLRLPSPAAPLRLLAAGTFNPQKGLDLAVDAARILEGRRPGAFVLTLAGSGPDAGVLRERAAAMVQAAQVVFTGNLDPERMAAEFRRADLFLLPTFREEGFPLVVSEALASGVPVIATRVGGNQAAVRDRVDGRLVPCGSAPALAEAIEELGDDPPMRLRMAQAGRRRAVEELDQEAVAASVEEALLAAAPRSSGAAGVETGPLRHP